MALKDLLNAGGSPVQAQRVFTNRVSEAEAFFDAMHRVQIELSRPDLVTNLSGPRRNILSFYGHGGIGKSALSKHLESLALRRGDSAPERTGAVPVTLRYDLSSTSARDPESILLALRATLAHAGIKAPAFDLAFAYYWSETHPGQPLTAYLAPSSFTNRAGQSLDLGSIIQDAATDIISTAADVSTFGGVGTVFRLTKRVAASVSQNLSSSRALKDCPHLAEALTEENMLDLRLFLPHFLAWDLHQVQRAAPVESAAVVVFFDSWEDVQADALTRGCLEDVLSQWVYLMPNMLFVVTGRDRLQWGEGDSARYLSRTGALQWPSLVLSESGETNQHLLGALSYNDSRTFVVGATAAAPIEPTVLHALIEQSGGHPDYLDAIIDLWQSALSGAAPLTADSARGGVAQVYQRVFRGLTTIEQDLLVAASLVPAFGEPLLGELVPQAGPSQIVRFVRRHFVESTTSDWLPYRLRPSVTDLVRASRSNSTLSWSPSQVDAALATAAELIVESSLPTGAARTLHDNARLDQGVKFVVALEQNGAVLPARTAELIFAANTAGCAGRLFAAELGLASRYFSQVLRSVVTLENAEAPTIGPPPPNAPDWLVDTHAVADARRILLAGDLSRSAEIMATIRDSTPVIIRRRAKLEILLASRSGSLKRGRELAAAWPVTDERNDLLGHIAYWQGQFVAAREHFILAEAAARSGERDLELARALRHRARVEALLDHADVDATLDLAAAANAALDSTIGLAQVAGARGIVAARRGNAPEAASLLESALLAFEQSGATIDVASLCVAGAVVGRLVQSSDVVQNWRARLASVYANDVNERLYVRTLAFVDDSWVAADAALADDYDSPSDTARAWSAVAARRPEAD
ncbi:hypothetical protein E3T55_18815 [Cryobacterium frigoriphilum]|uniref:Uncharacterized protein n=1 Tax=Cryobacterium frigoriphilum TaxID=1259150 RepID=A0A4R8ZTN2_9MICO|nr:hypothetical protein [Cryobacterium frigoriphilum]TFD45387.1 hypothetical protein E3T55_18815 [Cryobacterium frigoriphilum]